MVDNILVAEDDADIVKILKLYLSNDGMNVIEAGDGAQAMEKLRENHIDLAIVDIMMPEMDGYEVTKQIRSESNIPILLLSAKIQDADKILGLNMGADDYMTKPFNPLEVVARVKSNLRRYYKLNEAKTAPMGTVLMVKDLKLDMGTCTLERNGQMIPLTSTEYKILQLLMKHPGRIFTKIQIYERCAIF